MKYQTMIPKGQSRTLVELRQALLKAFQKPKFESMHYIDEGDQANRE
jgi:hypothetical protein